MREFVIAACLATAACAGASGKTDSAVARDTVVVSGPPASPATQATPPANAPAPAPTTDSVRGVVSVVGTSFDKKVMVAVSGTNRRVEIMGTTAALIGRVAGADVVVVGRLSGSQLEGASFVVRSVDGQPAIDGTLRTDAGALYIVTANGTRRRIVSPPPPLQGQDGARVWITGDPSKSVASFGFIDPRR